METFLTVSILFGTLTVVVNSQTTCSSSGPLFSLAAIRPVTETSTTQFFVIGGMFDVYQSGTTAYSCSTEMTEVGFINVVAFFWGIEQFSNPITSKSIKVGAVAFDNCLRPEQTIQNMYDYAVCRINIQNMPWENLVAYIGPYMNEDSERAGALAANLGVTIFSPMAESEKINFVDQKTLLKMRPSFTYDLRAIVEFLNKLKITFVIILYSGNDPFWSGAYKELTDMIKSSSVSTCIQYTADVDKEQITDIKENLKNRMSVRYIIPLIPKSKLSDVMSNLTTIFTSPDSGFIFIINSRIGRDRALMSPSQVSVDNSIIIEPSEPDNFNEILNNFNTFFMSLQKNNTTPGLSDGVGNKWLDDYYLKKPRLNFSDPATSSSITFSVYRTLLSVQTIMEGMNSVLNDCGAQGTANYQFCAKYRNLGSKGGDLYQRLQNSTDLFMKNSGELSYKYSSYSYYIFSSRNGKFTKIGSMTLNNMTDVSVTLNNLKDTEVYGYAFNDPTCPQPNSNQCCEATTTTVAPATTAIAANVSTMSFQSTANPLSQVMYPTGQAITGAFSNTDRKVYGTRFDVDQKWIIALGVLAGLGILCVLVFEIYILYKFLGTNKGSKWEPTGSRWRTMWLGQLLLFGIFLCYLVLFAYLPIPTKATCGITRFGVGVSYAFCFAVLLVKLMVILTSKPSSDVLLPGDIETPNYLKGTYQFLLFLFSFGVQVVIDTQWLITVPPEAILVTSNNGNRVWVCNHYTWQAGAAMDNMSAFVRTEFENHLMSLIYVMVLILLTTILSLKAHGIITNHRESIFVGIASGFTIPIWLAWGLIGGLNKSHSYAHEFGDAATAFGLLTTATLILFAMFLPKVRHLVNMGIEGIYIEDDRETIYGGSVILAPSSYKSKGSGSVIYVNNQGIYSEPVIVTNGDPMANHLKHPGSVYSVPGNYLKHPESVYGGSTRVLRVTDDLRGRHPQKRSQSEVAYGASRKPQSHKGTLPRSRSQTNLGAL